MDEGGARATVRHFPAERLAGGAAERLQQLFRHRERWTLAQLLPYIAAVLPPATSPELFLARHGRALPARAGAEKLYVAR